MRVPVCYSEVAHWVRCVSQAWMDPCVGLLGITRATRHFFLLPSLKAGCFGVQIPLCGFRETDRDLNVIIPHHKHNTKSDVKIQQFSESRPRGIITIYMALLRKVLFKLSYYYNYYHYYYDNDTLFGFIIFTDLNICNFNHQLAFYHSRLEQLPSSFSVVIFWLTIHIWQLCE